MAMTLYFHGNFAYETQSQFNSYDDVKKLLVTFQPTNTDIPKVSLDDRNGNRRSIYISIII